MSHFGYSVSVNGRTKVSAGAENLEDAISKAMEDCVYYKSIYPAGLVEIEYITEHCDQCFNIGTVNVRRPRSSITNTCPSCKGKFPMARNLGRIKMTMPDDANRVIIRQGTDDEFAAYVAERQAEGALSHAAC